MVLTEQQTDALTELINIAFARTGAALSDLTGQRVLLEPPTVALHLASEPDAELSRFVPGEVAWIHQVFDGAVAGDALLLLNYEGAVKLTELLTDDSNSSTRLDESAREVLTEVGNILLNACLGVFGNILRVHGSLLLTSSFLRSLSIHARASVKIRHVGRKLVSTIGGGPRTAATILSSIC